MWERSQRPATVDDVARLAGVSKTTAARVLGQYGSASVATRAAVNAAAATLNYRPNPSAKSMITGKTETIGVISRNVANPGFSLALDGIMSVGARAGVSVIVAGSEYDAELERAAVDVLLNRRVDALIVSPAHANDTEHLHAANRAGVPLVLLERRVNGLDVPVIESNQLGAGRAVAEYLRDLGHSRVGYVSTFPHRNQYRLGDEIGSSVIGDRLRGIYGTYAEAGIRPSTDLVSFPSRAPKAIQEAVIELLDREQPPTVLIASDGQIGLEALTALRSRGIRIPEQLSLLMFEDPRWSTLVDPALTVVVQPTYEMGRTAAEVALSLIDSDQEPQVPIFPAELVTRESVGPICNKTYI
jgi:LacI family transcriptional regulator